MKLLFVLMASLVASQAYANKGELVFVKQTSPGFTLPAYRSYMVCNVYEDRVEIRRGVNTLGFKEVRPVVLTGDIAKTMAAVVKAKRKNSVGPTDIPSTSYSLVPAPNAKPIVFQRRATRMVTTAGHEAATLKNFIDQLCN